MSIKSSSVGSLGVHLLLFDSDTLEGLSLDIFEDFEFRLLKHSFDLVQTLLEELQILSHHRQEVSLRHGIESSGVKCILLDDFVEEQEGILGLREAVGADQACVSLLGEGKELLLESSSPGDTVFFLLLDVLAGHVSCVIKEGNETLHHVGAESTSFNAIFPVDLFVNEHLCAHSLSRRVVEILLGLVVNFAHRDLLGSIGEFAESFVSTA